MTAPLPKTATSEIWGALNAELLTVTRWYSAEDPKMREWDRAVDRVANKHPGEANMCWGLLAQLRGDAEDMERFYENGGKYGIAGGNVESSLLTGWCNLVFASKGLAIAQKSVDVANLNISRTLDDVVSMGGVAKARALLMQASRANIPLEGVAQLPVIKRIVAELPAEVDDKDLAAAIDCAGEVLRSRQLFWLDREPRLLFDGGMGAMGIRYRVKLPAAEAARMNVELADLLISRELHLLPITLGFIGVGAE